ncbi:VirB4 family type IV secretion system protein [Thermogemmatispora sp.]|uniref:VirB4 family type IV secretion system protein n=1 Tax=Thermogemmatispora sp. TaxID=1968838 RepID=UPI0035E44157
MNLPFLLRRHSGSAAHADLWRYLPLDTVDEDGVLWRRAPLRGRASTPATTPVAILEVEGVNLLLRPADVQYQFQERFGRLLRALPWAVQILVRSESASTSGEVQAHATVQESEKALPPLLQTFRAWECQLLRGQELFRHRCYLVLKGDAFLADRPASLAVWPARRRPSEQGQAAALRHLLEERVQSLLDLLAQMGLSARRLHRAAVLDLLYHLFHPQRARQAPRPQDPPVWGPGQDLEWLAPEGLRATAKALILGEDHLIRHWIVRSWPRQVRSLWLWPLLVATPFELEVSFHLVPVPRTSAQRLLRRKLLEYRSLLSYAQEQQRVRDPLVALAHQDVERLLDTVGTGQEQLFLSSVYLALHASSPAQLEERSARLESTLRLLNLWAPLALYEQVPAWQACLPWQDDPINARVLLDSQTLATCLPFVSPTLLQPGGRFEGVSVSENTPVLLDPWASNWRNANRLIIGASGSGKSFKCKLDIVHALTTPPAQPHPDERHPDEGSIQVIVIDPEGEYLPLCEAVAPHGQPVRLAVGMPGSGGGGVNPFVLPRPRSADRAGEVLAEQVQWLLALLELLIGQGKEQPLTASEWSLLERAVQECYRERGMTADPQTHHIEPPLLRDLSRVLRSGVCGPDSSGLADRLQPFTSGSAAALFEPTPLELESRLTVFDLSGLGSLRAIGQYLVVHLVWRLARSSPHPRLLVIDELWGLFASTGPGGRLLLEQLFQRARKYFLSIYGVTQHVQILQDSSILANCASVLLLGQEPAAVRQLVELLQLSEEEGRLLAALSKGEGLLLLGDQHHLHLRFPAEPQVAQVITTDPRQREQLSGQPGKGDRTHEHA